MGVKSEIFIGMVLLGGVGAHYNSYVQVKVFQFEQTTDSIKYFKK